MPRKREWNVLFDNGPGELEPLTAEEVAKRARIYRAMDRATRLKRAKICEQCKQSPCRCPNISDVIRHMESVKDKYPEVFHGKPPVY
jgi:hypothetical protein